MSDLRKVLEDDPDLVTCITQISRTDQIPLVVLARTRRKSYQHVYAKALEFAAFNPDFPAFLAGKIALPKQG